MGTMALARYQSAAPGEPAREDVPVPGAWAGSAGDACVPSTAQGIKGHTPRRSVPEEETGRLPFVCPRISSRTPGVDQGRHRLWRRLSAPR